MTDISIPAGALEAGARAIYEVGYRGLLPEDQRREQARAAFLAMVGNWEGMQVDSAGTVFVSGKSAGTLSGRLILPLPKGPSNG